MYLGLLHEDGTEPGGSTGYHRVCLDHIHFGVAPPRGKESFAFINLDVITFPVPTSAWGTVCTLALFHESDDRMPCYRIKTRPPWCALASKGPWLLVNSHLTFGLLPWPLEPKGTLAMEPHGTYGLTGMAFSPVKYP